MRQPGGPIKKRGGEDLVPPLTPSIVDLIKGKGKL